MNFALTLQDTKYSYWSFRTLQYAIELLLESSSEPDEGRLAEVRYVDATLWQDWSASDGG